MTNDFLSSPMEFVIRLCCVGEIDEAKFAAAISNALKQQPLLQANADVGPTHRQSYWKPAANVAPSVQWLDGDPNQGKGYPDDFETIDLRDEIGIRVYGWQYEVDGQSRIEIKFVFHHACCDGKGAVGFVEQVISEYQLLLGETLDRNAVSLDCERILDRDRRQPYSFGMIDRVKRALLVRPKRVINMLFRSPAKLCWRPESTNELFADPPRLCSVTLDAETTKRLGAFAKSHAASTNAVVAAELFHVLNDCLTDLNGSAAKTNLLRIMIPFSLRDERHDQMPAANCVSMAYLEMQRDAIDRGMLANLQQQMVFIRKWKIQYSWIEAIESYARFWPLIRVIKRFQKEDKATRQVATAVMSNLGRVFDGACGSESCGKLKAGKLEVETVHLVLPCHENQSVNFAINFYRDRLTLDVSWLPSLVSQQTAQSLLNDWQQRILAVAKQ